MDYTLRKQINGLAESVIKVCNISTPINDIEDVVKRLGGIVIEDETLGMFSDGELRKENGELYEFSIKVPKGQQSARRNFTIAHELGHLFLHMGYMIDDELWNKSDGVVFNRRGNSESEMQANEFAAAFLMPEEEYCKIVNKNTTGNLVSISEVANYFNVSMDAASYRGKWLGCLRW